MITRCFHIVRIIAALTIVVNFTFSFNAFCDISWEQEDTVTSDGETNVFRQTIYIADDRFAIETPLGMRMIVDLAKGTMTTIDLNEKRFSTVTLQELEDMRENMTKNTDAIIEEALKSLPEDQREMYRKELEKQLADVEMDTPETDTTPSFEEYKASGSTATIAGYSAKHYRAEDDDGSVYEVWCTGDVDTAELEGFFRTASESSLISDLGGNYNTLTLGFPLKSVMTLDDGRTESVVTSVSTDTVPESVFTVPEGFEHFTQPLPTER